MSDQQYAVILVYSTSYALRAEKVLNKAGIACKLIPVPRKLSSDCGVCVRIDRADVEAMEQAVGAHTDLVASGRQRRDAGLVDDAELHRVLGSLWPGADRPLSAERRTVEPDVKGTG